MRKHFILIPCVMALAVGVVVVLTAAALRPLNEKMGFERRFKTPAPSIVSAVNKDQRITSISGIVKDQIYFKTQFPDLLYVTGLDLSNGRVIKLQMPAGAKVSKPFETITTTSNVYILSGNSRTIVKTSLDSLKTPKFYVMPGGVFTRAVQVSEDSYMLRGLDRSVKGDQIFLKKNIRSGSIVREHQVLERKHDAGLSTDGLLLYDPTVSIGVYVLFYKNEFVTIDTNCNLQVAANTIDKAKNTISTETIRNTMTSNSPNRIINGWSCVDAGRLYIASKIKADNELGEVFLGNRIIDIYDVKSGKYGNSFYIPEYKGEKMQRFSILGSRVIALFENYIVIYQL